MMRLQVVWEKVKVEELGFELEMNGRGRGLTEEEKTTKENSGEQRTLEERGGEWRRAGFNRGDERGRGQQRGEDTKDETRRAEERHQRRAEDKTGEEGEKK
jgi:hypothetical protein